MLPAAPPPISAEDIRVALERARTSLHAGADIQELNHVLQAALLGPAAPAPTQQQPATQQALAAGPSGPGRPKGRGWLRYVPYSSHVLGVWDPDTGSWHRPDDRAWDSCTHTNTTRVVIQTRCTHKHKRVLLMGTVHKSILSFVRCLCMVCGLECDDDGAKGGEDDGDDDGAGVAAVEELLVAPYPSFLWCGVCGVPPSRQLVLSKPASVFRDVLQSDKYSKDLLRLAMPEHRVLGCKSILDVYFPHPLFLGVMIDGEQHFKTSSPGGGGGGGSSGGGDGKKRSAARGGGGVAVSQWSSPDQERSDLTFNNAVLDGVAGRELKGIIRIHHACRPKAFAAMLARGVQYARDPCIKHFVYLSKKYPGVLHESDRLRTESSARWEVPADETESADGD